jgi:N-acetylmuramoyl-L-alanine amidase
VETGFLSNLSEEEYLNSEEGQSEVAEAILRAFKKYKREMEH